MQRGALFAIGLEIKMVHFLEPMEPSQGVVAFKLEQLLRKVGRKGYKKRKKLQLALKRRWR